MLKALSMLTVGAEENLFADSYGALLFVAPPMRCLNVVWMVVPPCSSHSFRIPVVRHDIVVIRELFVTDGAFPVLFDDFAVQHLSHFCRRAEFAVSSRMMWVFDAANASL
jgi:hypothetical protein